jgi:hypothetical protein
MCRARRRLSVEGLPFLQGFNKTVPPNLRTDAPLLEFRSDGRCTVAEQEQADRRCPQGIRGEDHG